MASPTSARIRAVFLLFFSGAAALIYQTIWVKQLALVVGVDVHAVTTAVAGLALGSAVLGRRADRVSRPLALYAILEVGIAVCGVGATLALARSGSVFVTLQDSVGPLAWALPFAAVGVPAFLMGGTLPVLMRDSAPDDASVGRSSGVPHDKLARLLARQHGGTLVFYEESSGGTVAVLEDRAAAGSFHRLYIQGVSNSGDSLPSLRYMRLQALLPLLIHNDKPRSALVIGHGTGITAGALLSYPDLDRRVCAELLPAVVRASDLFKGNMGVAADSRVEIRVRDGRHVLLSSDERYDLITSEPPPPSASGVVNLYSRDFYELARDRLEPNGLPEAIPGWKRRWSCRGRSCGLFTEPATTPTGASRRNGN